jgi:hypothetical protein
MSGSGPAGLGNQPLGLGIIGRALETSIEVNVHKPGPLQQLPELLSGVDRQIEPALNHSPMVSLLNSDFLSSLNVIKRKMFINGQCLAFSVSHAYTEDFKARVDQ